MTTITKRRTGSLAKAVLLTPIALGLALGPAAASMAAPAADGEDQQAQESDAILLEVPTLEEVEIPGIGESSYETRLTWGLDVEPITDITTEEGPLGDRTSEEGEGTEDGEDVSDPSEEPSPEPTDDGKVPEGADPAGGSATSPSDDSCDVGEDATADKVLLIDGTSGSDAEATTCEKTDDGQYVEVESYDAHVGYNGIAAEGKKVEGDGKTPSGTFNLTDGFGVQGKPTGFSGNWVKLSEGDIWVDDPNSPLYNTFVPAEEAEGVKGEELYESPAYDYAQIIDYNTERTPGAGSAIFLHVNTGSGATAGCVSLPESDLLDVFEWADADTEIQIVQ